MSSGYSTISHRVTIGRCFLFCSELRSIHAFPLDLFITSNFWISMSRRRSEPKIIQFKCYNKSPECHCKSNANHWNRYECEHEWKWFTQNQSKSMMGMRMMYRTCIERWAHKIFETAAVFAENGLHIESVLLRFACDCRQICTAYASIILKWSWDLALNTFFSHFIFRAFSLLFSICLVHILFVTHTHIYANSKREFPWKPDAIEWDKRYFTIQIKLLQDSSKRKDRTEREYIWTKNRIVLDDMEGRMIQTEVENFHALRKTMWIIVLVCVVYACICMSYVLYHKKTPIHTRAHVILKLSKQWAYPLRIPPWLYVCVSVREHGCVHVIVCVKAESERNEEQREERRKKEIDVGKIGT